MTHAPTRIAFAITELDDGGAERAFVRIVTGLDPSRWTPSIICLSSSGPLVEPLQSAGIPVECLRLRQRHESATRQQRTLIRACCEFSRLLRVQQPAILQTFLFHANIAGRVAAKVAGISHVVSGIRVAERRSQWRLRLDRWSEGLVDRHVCVSQAVAEFSINQSGLSRSKVVAIPNGVDVELFRDAEPTDLSNFGIEPGSKVVLSVGRLDEQKDPLVLLAAFEQLAGQHADARLLFVGQVPLEASLRAEVVRRGLDRRVHFAGRQSNIAGIMRAADVFVLASKWEGMPNVVLEAAAAGLPIVSTRAEGVAEIIDDGRTGLLVEIGNANALAAAIRETLQNPTASHARAISLQSRVAEAFSWPAVIAQYERLYESLLPPSA